MANYGWFPLDISNPLAYTWSPTGNWGTGADWANLASTTFPPLTGTVPGSGDSAYIVTANVPSSLIPAPYPAPPYNVDITVNSPVQIGALGLGKYQPSASFGFPASSAVIDITGVSFQVTGSIVDCFTRTFPMPIGTVSASGGGIIELASSASLEVGTTVDPNITVHFNDATDKVILDGVSSTAATAVQAQ